MKIATSRTRLPKYNAGIPIMRPDAFCRTVAGEKTTKQRNRPDMKREVHSGMICNAKALPVTVSAATDTGTPIRFRARPKVWAVCSLMGPVYRPGRAKIQAYIPTQERMKAATKRKFLKRDVPRRGGLSGGAESPSRNAICFLFRFGDLRLGIHLPAHP